MHPPLVPLVVVSGGRDQKVITVIIICGHGAHGKPTPAGQATLGRRVVATRLPPVTSPLHRLISPDEIDPDSREPVSRQLANAIRRRIETGELRTGDRLPSMRELLAMPGVTRGAVDLAYRLLAGQAYVVLRNQARHQVRGRPSARSISASRYAEALSRVSQAIEAPELTDIVRAHGVDWADYAVVANYSYQPATKAQAEALRVAPGVSVLRRTMVEYIRDVPVQVRRSVMLATDVRGTSVAEPSSQPWPDGTVAEIWDLGHVVTRVVERAEFRPASPAEGRDLILPDKLPLLEVTRVFWASHLGGPARPLEASELVMPAAGNTLEWTTEI